MPNTEAFDPASLTEMASKATDQSLQGKSGEVATSSAPQTSSEVDPVLEGLKAKGYDVSNFKSGEELIDSLAEAERERRNLEQLAGYGRQYLQHADGFEQWRSEQAKKAQAPQPEDNKPKIWDAPEYNPEWEKYAKWDGARGQFVPVSEYVSPVAAQKLNEYKQWLPNGVQRLAREWPTLVKAQLDEYLPQMREEMRREFEAQRRQAAAQNSAAAFLEQNKKDLYVLDNEGRVMIDPITNAERLTPKGEAVKWFSAEAQQMGITDPFHIQGYVKRQLESYDIKLKMSAIEKAQKEQEAAAERANEEGKRPNLKETFVERARKSAQASPMNGAAHSPNRDQTLTDDLGGRRIQNPEDSFKQMAYKLMKEKGLNTSVD